MRSPRGRSFVSDVLAPALGPVAPREGGLSLLTPRSFVYLQCDARHAQEAIHYVENVAMQVFSHDAAPRQPIDKTSPATVGNRRRRIFFAQRSGSNADSAPRDAESGGVPTTWVLQAV